MRSDEWCEVVRSVVSKRRERARDERTREVSGTYFAFFAVCDFSRCRIGAW